LLVRVIGPGNHGIEARHLRYFVAVAEERGFRRAAERLHVSQPPLSQQVAQLEERVGAQLLVRSRQGVALTRAGEAFLRDARTVLADLDRAVETARRAGAGETGLVRVGFVGSAVFPVVPDIVRAFRAARPDVEVRLRELPTAAQLDALTEGALDVGFARLPLEAPELAVERVAREPVVAALPEGHPLTERAIVRLDALAREPFVMFPRAQAPRFFDHLVASVAATGVVPRVVQEAPEMQTIVSLVASGLGVSLVPASVSALALGGVAYRAIHGGPDAELAVVWRRDRADPAVAAFVEVARRRRRARG
jgi:DNA-binding transcriptional LysR family regulator